MITSVDNLSLNSYCLQIPISSSFSLSFFPFPVFVPYVFLVDISRFSRDVAPESVICLIVRGSQIKNIGKKCEKTEGYLMKNWKQNKENQHEKYDVN